MSIRAKITEVFNEIWAEDHDVPPPALADDTVLLETGMDSMAFAVLVARLDEELGFDPFTQSDDVYYPREFGEFVAFYEKFATL